MAAKKARKSPFEAVIFLLCAVFLVPLGFQDAEKQFDKLQGYRPTMAVIMSGKVVEKEGDDGTLYCPVLRYRYVADDKWLESEALRPLGYDDCGSRSEAEGLLKLHPPGRQLRAYVDPVDPARSFLLADRSNKPYLMMLGGMAFLLLGLWLLDVRPRGGRSFRWVWALYGLAGALVLVHNRLTGGAWGLAASALVWALHASVPFLTRGDPSWVADD